MDMENENWFGTVEQGQEDEVGDKNPRCKTPKAELGQTKKGNTAAGILVSFYILSTTLSSSPT